MGGLQPLNTKNDLFGKKNSDPGGCWIPLNPPMDFFYLPPGNWPYPCFPKAADIEYWNWLNPSQTYVATALRPLRDWQFTPIAEVVTRSPIGPGEVAEKSATDRGPRCDQISRRQVFVLAQKTWLRLIWSQTGPGKVADQSPISRRLVADRSPTNFVRIGAWLSLKLVGDWSAIGRRLIGDLSATSLQLVGDLSATCSKMYSIS